jgi:uncharacterized membrane protein YcaP (DUF421 family)
VTAPLLAVAHGVPPVSAHRVGVQAIKTAIVFVLLVVGFRVLGKREAAQLNVYDLALLMALANAVQNAMTGGLGNFPIGLAASSTLVVAAFVLTRIIVRRPAVERQIVGTPVLLVNRGQVLPQRLRRNLVTPAELDEACRQHGLDGPGGCDQAVLEVDGSISIVPRSNDTATPPTPSDATPTSTRDAPSDAITATTPTPSDATDVEDATATPPPAPADAKPRRRARRRRG